MGSVLLFGLLIGMQHALEADHVAAVSSLACRHRSPAAFVRHGAVWGIGHTATLMGVAGGFTLAGLTVSNAVSSILEGAVGLLLLLLGGHVLYRLARERVHFHSHRHADGTVHFHAHSHAGELAADHAFRHDHEHPRGLPVRTLLVGMMHGLAGSGALVVLTASTVRDPALGLLCILLFGLGSIVGMAVLSALIAVPLAWTARTLTVANRALQAAVGGATCGLGLIVLLGVAAS